MIWYDDLHCPFCEAPWTISAEPGVSLVYQCPRCLSTFQFTIDDVRDSEETLPLVSSDAIASTESLWQTAFYQTTAGSWESVPRRRVGYYLDRLPKPAKFDNKYEVQETTWHEIGVAHWKAMYFPLWMLCLLVGSVAWFQSLLPIQFSLIWVILLPLVLAAPTDTALRLVRGTPIKYFGLLGGWPHFANLLGLYTILGTGTGFLFAPLGCAWYFGILDGVFLTPASVVIGLLWIASYVRVGLFASLIVIDQGVSPIQAIRWNLSLTKGHLKSLFWVTLTNILTLTIASTFLCIFGVTFFFPQIVLSRAVAYLAITRQEEFSLPTRETAEAD